MKRLLLLILLPAPLWSQAGDWIATLDFLTAKVRLALHLDGTGGKLTGTADAIDQDSFGNELAQVKANGSTLAFEVPKLGGRFRGVVSADGNTIEGEWRQRSGRLAIRFVRGNIRPQEPAPPYPYEQRDITCRNGPIRLAGTLTLPRGVGPHPAVVLITGSGPQDRNETTSGHRPFLTWSDYLTRRGMAVLRMDDRGVGGSTGKLLDSTDEDFAGDALAAVEFLKGVPGIDARRIGLLGHSEGGVIAPLAAQRSQDIAYVVLLAGPAIPGDELLLAQSERVSRAMGVPDEVARKNREVQRELFRLAQNVEKPEEARRQIEAALKRRTADLSKEESAVVRGQLGGQLSMASSRWFRFVWRYDPRPVLEKVACPILALFGTLDVQVPADLNRPAMETAIGKGWRNRVETVTGVNHLFQTAETGSPLEYAQIEETVSPRVLELVGNWIAGTIDRR